jgi:murein DD-endopeptidase MepM/ murein hydrolase activator NlpD
LAFQLPRAPRASTLDSGVIAAGSPRPGGPPASPRFRLLRARAAIALVLTGVLVAVVAVPTAASWPVASRSSYVSQWYRSSHRADDIAAAGGTRILPIRSGRVVFAGWRSNCGGYQVWVSHGSGLYSAYYHMSRETSWSGRWVTRGSSTLGYVGRTGCASGNHLHIEVWRGYPWRSGSYRVNPWNYIDSGYYLPYRYR